MFLLGKRVINIFLLCTVHFGDFPAFVILHRTGFFGLLHEDIASETNVGIVVIVSPCNL